MPKPSPDTLYQLAEAIVERNAKRDRMFDTLDKLYYMDNARAKLDEGVELVQMPYGTSVVDLITDLAAVMKINVSVPAASESMQAEKDAEELEAWCRSWLAMNMRKQQQNLIGLAGWGAAQRAIACARTLFVDKSVKLDEETPQLAGLPVVLQLRDPRHVYVADGPLGPRYVIERWSRPAIEVRALYPKVLDPEIDDDTDVEWTEYWDDTYRAYFVDGAPVPQRGGKVVPHGYGCLPYAFGYARQTMSREPEKRFRPVLVAVEPLAHSINTWFSIAGTAGLAAVTNAWAVYSDRLTGENGKELDLAPGKINFLGSLDKVQALQRAALPPDFYQWGTQLFQAWQSETFPFNLFGQSPGDIAGYAISLLSQAGRRIILPVWNAIENMLAGALLNCLIICRNKVAPLVGDKIPLVITETPQGQRRAVRRTLRLDVSKFGDDLEIQVKLGDPMPQDEAGNVRMALESTAGKLLSNETALQKWGIVTDPASEMERIAAEAIWKQLVPLEGLKLAQERGYAPREFKLPKGWLAGQDGTLVPQAIIESMQQAQAIMAGQQPATNLQGPAQQGMPPLPQPGAMSGPQPDPALLQALLAQQTAPQGAPQSPLMGAPGMPPAGLPPAPAPGGGLPPGLTPELLGQLYQLIQAGLLPTPSGTGEPTGLPDITALNSLAGAAIEPRLEDMSGDNNQIRRPEGF